MEAPCGTQSMRPQRHLRRWIELFLQALGDVTCLIFLGGCTSAALALLDLGADPDAGHGSGADQRA